MKLMAICMLMLGLSTSSFAACVDLAGVYQGVSFDGGVFQTKIEQNECASLKTRVVYENGQRWTKIYVTDGTWRSDDGMLYRASLTEKSFILEQEFRSSRGDTYRKYEWSLKTNGNVLFTDHYNDFTMNLKRL
ncbi:MAG: hypothetical protein AB7F59_07165 [Bdellovibrionales bacterium]